MQEDQFLFTWHAVFTTIVSSLCIQHCCPATYIAFLELFSLNLTTLSFLNYHTKINPAAALGLIHAYERTSFLLVEQTN
jgi:hypothetical protein